MIPYVEPINFNLDRADYARSLVPGNCRKCGEPIRLAGDEKPFIRDGFAGIEFFVEPVESCLCGPCFSALKAVSFRSTYVAPKTRAGDVWREAPSGNGLPAIVED